MTSLPVSAPLVPPEAEEVRQGSCQGSLGVQLPYFADLPSAAPEPPHSHDLPAPPGAVPPTVPGAPRLSGSKMH